SPPRSLDASCTAPADASLTVPPPLTGRLAVTGPPLISETAPLDTGPVLEKRTGLPPSSPLLLSRTLRPVSWTGPLPAPTLVLDSNTGPLSEPTGPLLTCADTRRGGKTSAPARMSHAPEDVKRGA